MKDVELIKTFPDGSELLQINGRYSTELQVWPEGSFAGKPGTPIMGVTVMHPDERRGKLHPAEVSWASHGAVSTEEARRYANLILDAVAVAQQLNDPEVETYRWSKRPGNAAGNPEEIS
jgi:hypothetical protein